LESEVENGIYRRKNRWYGALKATISASDQGQRFESEEENDMYNERRKKRWDECVKSVEESQDSADDDSWLRDSLRQSEKIVESVNALLHRDEDEILDNLGSVECKSFASFVF